MKECLNLDFKKVCKLDIDDLLFQIEEYMPKIKTWQMNSSVIMGDNFKVICKGILDAENKNVGYSINVNAYEDVFYNYDLILHENCICLDKTYTHEENLIKESYQVAYDGKTVIRACSYQEGEEMFNFYDVSPLENINYGKESLTDICNNLKNEASKVRVR